MKVLQTIAGFGALYGGIATCTYDLMRALHAIGSNVDLLTSQVKDCSDKLMGNGEVWLKALPNDCVTPFGYTQNIRSFLSESDYDIYHTNGLWQHCNHVTCAEARRKKKPYVITPHGMLYPEALARSAWKKTLMRSLFFDKDLRLATCIQATCKAEMKHYRDLGYTNPVAVIPNPCPVPNYISEIKRDRSVKRIGYLGRLHPRKNVEALIDAWIRIGDENGQLVIMGKGDDAYEQILREKVTVAGLKNVEFAGFINGKTKFEKLATLTALCVPSDFENFGMIVTEALTVGTPVMTSLGTPWEDLQTYNCGWWIKNDVDTVTDTILKAFALPQSKLDEMGENGRRLVAEKYSDIQVAKQMQILYDWILGEGVKPAFVFD